MPIIETTGLQPVALNKKIMKTILVATDFSDAAHNAESETFL